MKPTATQTSDTHASAEARQLELWKSMRPSDKAELVREMVRACYSLALAGAQLRAPDASEAELQREVAELWYGPSVLPGRSADEDRQGSW